MEQILSENGVNLNSAIYADLKLLGNLTTNKHTHIAFLLDKNNNILSYKPNIYFKTKTFPFSQHAEISTIIAYYSKQNIKKSINISKRLIVIKLGKNGMRMSKPCQQCATFIANNWSNLKLKEVLYSDTNGNLQGLTKKDLEVTSNFCRSSAYRK